MVRKSWRLITALGVWVSVLALTVPAWGATLGRAVAIGGHASDIALDEARGVLYVANFTANRIDVMSLVDYSIQSSINVAPLPASIAMSPGGRYLLVTHFANFEPPATANNALTVIDLETRGKQTFALGSPALGVAFGRGSDALVVTATDFSLFDPVSGTARLLYTIPELAATSLPAPPLSFPANITKTALNVSGDGTKIYGLTDTFTFGYDVTNRWLRILGYTSDPEQGPRVVSVNYDGSRHLAGWVLHGSHIWNRSTGIWNLAQFPDAEGILEIGSHAIDDSRRLIYAQVTQAAPEDDGADCGITGDCQSTVSAGPTLQVLNYDNLAVLEQINLPENLAGKSLINSDYSTMYSISDSGVLVIPLGILDTAPRVVADKEDVFFHSDFCGRGVMTQEFVLYDPSGRRNDFFLSVDGAGVEVSPQTGETPATIQVRVDPTAFQNQSGTAEALINISSGAAVNKPKAVRVVTNTPQPDQRGTVINVPGDLVDILADPVRDRFFILRQDTNEVLVFDGNTYARIATLSTGNTPTQMAITFDRRWLLVGHANSQFVSVFDLDTLQASAPIQTPGGHYPQSVAASAKSILTANRVAGPIHTIDRVNMSSRIATQLPTLGVWQNDIDEATVLVGSPNGATILAAQPDGKVFLYDANADTFTISRQDAEELAGAYAASSFNQFVIGNRLMNASLVTTNILETGTGLPSGFAFVDLSGFRTTAPQDGGTGVIQRVDLQTGRGIRATRMAEAPPIGTEARPFTRTLAPLYTREVIVSLTTSGFTVLPWNYDASVASPRIGGVVNAADYTMPVAPGGLISIFGENMSPINQASSQLPLPTALGESCLTVNGLPTPILFVSPNQINAQLPFETEGNVTLALYTPGGVSDNHNLTILPTAPRVFQSTADNATVPAIVRYHKGRSGNGQLVTPSNPVAPEDYLVIYLTGMGRTSPAIDAGVPSPLDPPANAIMPPMVYLNGIDLPVSYAGLAPGQVGVYQINAFVPWWMPHGDNIPLEISQGSSATTVRVNVH